MRKKVLLVAVIAIVAVMAFAGCSPSAGIPSYSIPMIDLDQDVVRQFVDGKMVEKVFDQTTLDTYKEMFTDVTEVALPDALGENNQGKKEQYLGHPDSVELKREVKGSGVFDFTDKGEILTMYPLGHGKGQLFGKYSTDGGKSYTTSMVGTPKSWEFSQETPILYRLVFNENNVPDDNDLLILTSGNPSWPGDSRYKPNGFNVSISAPSIEETTGDKVEGRVWSEFETWYGHGLSTLPGGINREPQNAMKAYDCIVAMSSLTRLKKEVEVDGVKKMVWDNKWMGLFHDHGFNCYKTILSFEEPAPDNTFPTYNVCGKQMVMKWSEPVKYFTDRKLERKTNMCEVECVRSDAGQGDTLALITRSNSKVMNSLIMFSHDEGKTWTDVREVPYALSGERHKAEWVKVEEGGKMVDKLFITFRSIERSTAKNKLYPTQNNWMSEGYVAWVGDWDDLVKGTEGDFRVKLAHTYLSGQTQAQVSANADTGYCGNVVLTKSGKVATCSYGRFSPESDPVKGQMTYILGKVVDVNALSKILPLAKVKPVK